MERKAHGPADLVRQARLAEEAGFDEVYIGQVGGEHEGFFEFYANTVLPRLRDG
jgi:alkanesulfonate monooxygenase SsuD/methylene tetrahydromethanopterin reductase-like flavin-dependent oxidoreductase (luciferase family)